MRMTASGLTFRVDGRPIVDAVSLDVVPGEFLAIVGPNGSGKTTLISMLAGLKRPHAGAVTLDGTGIGAIRPRDLAKTVALVEQQAETGERLTARQVVELGRTPHLGPLSPWSERDRGAVQAALDAVDMLPFADRLWPSLSGGERQRLHIARALAQEPKILILDEPTNHLDVEHQIGLLALVQNRGITVIAALHDLNHAAMFADRIAVLHAGRLVALDAPPAVLSPERIAGVFKVEAEVEATADGRCFIRYAAPKLRAAQPTS